MEEEPVEKEIIMRIPPAAEREHPEVRQFYLDECTAANWSTCQLANPIRDAGAWELIQDII